jgi:hypothetical protein
MIHSRVSVSFLPLGAATAEITTTAGAGADPVSTSSSE